MGRKKFVRKREILPDPKFHDVVVAKFINTLMTRGKRSIAEAIFYNCMDNISERTGEEGVKIFKKALENAKPMLEVKSRRVGGATYQVPVEVRSSRRQTLAMRWVIEAARARTEKSMAYRIAHELMDAAENRGGAVRKREDTHRMAEANKAFAHYRW
jgi:small subunit ribosomal protein S7